MRGRVGLGGSAAATRPGYQKFMVDGNPGYALLRTITGHIFAATQALRGIYMRHFGHLAPEARRRLFHREPAVFTAESPAPILATALGATLYSPATRPTLADDVHKQAARGVVSMVLCLEDSIADADVPGAEANLVAQFADLAARAEAGEAEPRSSSSGSATPSRSPTWCAASAPPSACSPASSSRSSPRSAACPTWRRWPPPRPAAGTASSPCPSWNPPSCSTSRPAPPRSPGSPAPSTSTATGSWPCGWASPTSAPPTGCAARPT